MEGSFGSSEDLLKSYEKCVVLNTSNVLEESSDYDDYRQLCDDVDLVIGDVGQHLVMGLGAEFPTVPIELYKKLGAHDSDDDFLDSPVLSPNDFEKDFTWSDREKVNVSKEILASNNGIGLKKEFVKKFLFGSNESSVSAKDLGSDKVGEPGVEQDTVKDETQGEKSDKIMKNFFKLTTQNRFSISPKVKGCKKFVRLINTGSLPTCFVENTSFEKSFEDMKYKCFKWEPCTVVLDEHFLQVTKVLVSVVIAVINQHFNS